MAGRALSRIAFCGRKILFTIRTEPGPAKPNLGFPGCPAPGTHRFVTGHLVSKPRYSGLPFVAATNCLRHSATPIEWKLRGQVLHLCMYRALSFPTVLGARLQDLTPLPLKACLPAASPAPADDGAVPAPSV